MPRGTLLTSNERKLITNKLANGLNSAQIGKELGRDARTIRKAIQDINFKRKPNKHKGTSIVSKRDMQKLQAVLKKHPLLPSKAIFAKAGVLNRSKTTRCKVLRMLGSVKKAEKRPPISAKNKIQRKIWARNYMKIDFNNVLFTDECRATLDGPDGWRRGWIISSGNVPWVLRRQQGGGGVMFWAGIVGNRIVGPFKVDSALKMNSEIYSQFLDDNFFKWYRVQSRKFKQNCVFMHDNAPAHASKYTTAYLQKKGISNNKIMNWPAQSPDLNPIENLWAIIKRRVYPGPKQYNSKAALWDAIKSVCAAITPEEIQNLTASMDNRLFTVIE